MQEFDKSRLNYIIFSTLYPYGNAEPNNEADVVTDFRLKYLWFEKIIY